MEVNRNENILFNEYFFFQPSSVYLYLEKFIPLLLKLLKVFYVYFPFMI